MIYVYISNRVHRFTARCQQTLPKRGEVANGGDCTLFRSYTVRMKLKNVGLLTILGIYLHGYLLCDFLHLTTLLFVYCKFTSNITQHAAKNNSGHSAYHHHQILLLLVEHRASMKSFQALQSPASPLTSFRDLLVLLISSSTVLRHVLFGLHLLLYP